MNSNALRHIGFFALALSSPLTAIAHHPMESQTPGTALEGLLSGLGHPVIEPSHLFMMLGVALLMALMRLPARAVIHGAVSLSVASMIGTLVTGLLGTPAGLALGLALTLWVLALAIGTGLAASRPVLFNGAIVVGLIHGLAYGEAVIGAESTPLLCYLAGIAIIQTGLVVLAVLAAKAFLYRRVAGQTQSHPVGSQIAAVLLVGVGIQGLLA